MKKAGDSKLTRNESVMRKLSVSLICLHIKFSKQINDDLRLEQKWQPNHLKLKYMFLKLYAYTVD